MGVGRRFLAAAPFPGGVLVAGGDSGASKLSSAEVYNPATGTFTSAGVGSMGGARDGPAAASLPDGRVLVAGGHNCSSFLSSAEVFTPDKTLTVAKAGVGSGAVTSSPSGINCGGDCTESYDHGTVVTLTATPNSGSTLAGWSGGGCSGTGTCMVTMDADKAVTAMFNAVPPQALQPKFVNLRAKPKKVAEGRKTTLTAVVSPCGGHEGDLVEFYRGSKKISTNASDVSCTARVKVKMKKSAKLKAVSPQQDSDHMAGTSNTVKVNILR